MAFKLEDLDLADRHIDEAEARIARQEAILRGLADDGHDTKQGEALLTTYRGALASFREHKALIIKDLGLDRSYYG